MDVGQRDSDGPWPPTRRASTTRPVSPTPPTRYALQLVLVHPDALTLLDHNHHLSVIPSNGMADPVPQSDVSRPSALPTANLLQRPTVPLVDQNSNEYLDGIEEEWNKKVDTEIDTLVDGMVDLVGLASVSGSRHLCDDGAYSR